MADHGSHQLRQKKYRPRKVQPTSVESQRQRAKRERWEKVAADVATRVRSAILSPDDMLFIATDVCSNRQVYGKEVIYRLERFYACEWELLLIHRPELRFALRCWPVNRVPRS